MSIYAYDMGREDGRDEERERIIKLLTDIYDSDKFVGLNMHEVIALIKGENK
jgi:hypothetical protein